MEISSTIKFLVSLLPLLATVAALVFTVYCWIGGYQWFPIVCGMLLTAGFGFFTYLKTVKNL